VNAELPERSDHRPLGIFDVRDHYHEQQYADGLAATVSGRVRFTVRAVVTPEGRVEPPDWVLDTRPTLSGLSVFLDRVVEERRPPVLRKLAPSATSIELRVSCPRFQAQDITFQPAPGQRVQVDLTPAVDYPFERISKRPGQPGPALLRGAVRDETDRGVPGAVVRVPEGLYEYRTDRDGTWVIVLPDDLPWAAAPAEDLDVAVQVTVTTTDVWRTAEVLPEAGPGGPWSQNGLLMTRTVTAVRGATVSVPNLRLRLS
jgi:hypothetical protein